MLAVKLEKGLKTKLSILVLETVTGGFVRTVLLSIITDVTATVSGGQVDGQSASSPLSGIYIKDVKPDSPAAASGLLKNGDRILEVP